MMQRFIARHPLVWRLMATALPIGLLMASLALFLRMCSGPDGW